VDDQPEGLQQKVKYVAAKPTVKRVGDTHLSVKADGSRCTQQVMDNPSAAYIIDNISF
jgi:hypothetical protein